MAALYVYGALGIDLLPWIAPQAVTLTLTPGTGPRTAVAVIVGCALLWPLLVLVLIRRR